MGLTIIENHFSPSRWNWDFSCIGEIICISCKKDAYYFSFKILCLNGGDVGRWEERKMKNDIN